MAKINQKKDYVENNLRAKFEFIARFLTKDELQFVRDNMDVTRTWKG